MKMERLSDGELLDLDASKEIESLRSTIERDNPLHPYILMLALRRVVAEAQLQRDFQAANALYDATT